MDKTWLEKQKKEEENKNNAFLEDIFNGIRNPELFDEDDRKKIIKAFVGHCFSVVAIYLDERKSEQDEAPLNKSSSEWLNNVDLKELDRQNGLYNNRELLINRWNSLLDSEPKYFSGDIIITDPGYLIKENNETVNLDYPDARKYLRYDFPMQYDDFKLIDIDYSSIQTFQDVKKFWKNLEKLKQEHFVVCDGYSETYEKELRAYNKAVRNRNIERQDDWSCSNYGENMEVLGLKTCMVRNTIYGDWSCTTYNSDTKEPIGNFCADGGLVGVFLLDEVLKYNPEFDNHIKRPWTTTLIKNFEGTVQFIVSQGEKEDDFNVSVIGHGVNKKTGEPLNFFTTQTGL